MWRLWYKLSVSELDQVHWLYTDCRLNVYTVDLYDYCSQHMEQEGGSDLLQFWLATDNFQQHLLSCDGHYDGIQAQSDAMIIYDK